MALDTALRQHNSGLIVRHARAADAIVQLANELGVDAVFANADYEPYATQRDQAVKQALISQHRDLLLFKDHVIFERDEILSNAGTPFSIFTAYKNCWLKRLSPTDVAEHGAVPMQTAGLPFERRNNPTCGSSASSQPTSMICRCPRAKRAPSPCYATSKRASTTMRRRETSRSARAFDLSCTCFRHNSTRQLARSRWRRRGSMVARAVPMSGVGADLARFHQMILWHHPPSSRRYRPEYDRFNGESGEAADGYSKPGVKAPPATH